MQLSKDVKRTTAALIFLSVIFLYLRIGAMGHLLMWDEAWNMLSLRAFVLDSAADPFYWFYFYHPPAYMFLAGFLSPTAAGLDIRLELLSLALSYGTFVVVYIMSWRVGGMRLAVPAGLFLSLMPSSVAYDTWIKRDPVSCLFGYISLLLLSARKYMWCAVALGLSLLGKENGIFFVLAAFLMLFISGAERPVRKILRMCLVILALSSWWYVIFSEMTTHGSRFFARGTTYSATWGAGLLFYFRKLAPDMGPFILVLFIFGMAFIFYRTFLRKDPSWFFPAAIFICTCAPISLIFSLKPPWLSIPAIPAAGMIAGAGAFCLLQGARKYKVLYFILALLVAGAFYTGLTFSYPAYHTKTNPKGWPGALSSRNLAFHLNDRMGENDRLLITEFEYWNTPTCPVFLYYWKGHPVKFISSREKAADVAGEIRAKGIQWFVVVGTPSPGPKSGFRKLARDFTDLTGLKPETVNWSYVWDTRPLLKKD